MVLFKRKTVRVPPPAKTPVHDDQEVWFIPETLEYFCTYDEYLERMDFYLKNKFICELSGASCLTFFDARNREIRETQNVIRRFPEPLKRPILARVQMATITRLDQLVDELYAWLKDRFFVGELVTVRFQDQRVRAEVTRAENNVYQVDDGERILEGDASQLIRDRKAVSKLTLRAFVKHSASREQWIGAPWIVRSDYVTKYNLSREVPPEVQKLLRQRSEDAAQAAAATTQTKQAQFDDDEDVTLDELEADESVVAATPRGRPQSVRLSRKRIMRTLEALPESYRHRYDDLFQLALHVGDEPLQSWVELRVRQKPWPRWHRDERLASFEKAGKVGHLFEVWLFTQFFHELLGLSPDQLLTFDDFVDALAEPSIHDSIAAFHCSVFSLLVPEGKSELVVALPSQAEEVTEKRVKRGGRPRKRARTTAEYDDDEGADDDDDDEVDPDDDQDAEPEAAPDTAKGSENFEDETEHSSDPNSPTHANGGDASWVERVGHRQFANGGWQHILAEILRDLCYLREWKADTEAVVDHLLPPGQEHTSASVAAAYTTLDVVHRVHAIMMIVRILYGSAQLRDYLDAQYEQLTKLKKRSVQRELKTLQEDLRAVERCINVAKGSTETNADSVSPPPKDPTKDESGEGSNSENLEQVAKSLSEQYSEKLQESREIALQMSRLDTQRLRFLGKDRFFNRYWWMDSHGLAAASDEGYSMGKLCVQGPSPEDLEQCLNSKTYEAEFVDYRRQILSETQKLKFLHRTTLKQRREARQEADRHVASVHVPESAQSSPLPETESNANVETSKMDMEKRLRHLLDINRVMHGLTEEETSELRELQSKLQTTLGGTDRALRAKDTEVQVIVSKTDGDLDSESQGLSGEPGEGHSTNLSAEGDNSCPSPDSYDQKPLTEQQKRLKQAQEQVQMQVQLAARVQAHFDAEVRAQADARMSSQPASAPQAPQTAQPPYVATAEQIPQPAVGLSQQIQQTVQQPYIGQLYPPQEQFQWVVQQTAYGPMLYAIPNQQYHMLVQQYGMQSGLMPGAPPNGDAYQAFLQQVAMQQPVVSQGYPYPGYSQPMIYGQPGLIPTQPIPGIVSGAPQVPNAPVVPQSAPVTAYNPVELPSANVGSTHTMQQPQQQPQQPQQQPQQPQQQQQQHQHQHQHVPQPPVVGVMAAPQTVTHPQKEPPGVRHEGGSNERGIPSHSQSTATLTAQSDVRNHLTSPDSSSKHAVAGGNAHSHGNTVNNPEANSTADASGAGHESPVASATRTSSDMTVSPSQEPSFLEPTDVQEAGLERHSPSTSATIEQSTKPSYLAQVVHTSNATPINQSKEGSLRKVEPQEREASESLKQDHTKADHDPHPSHFHSKPDADVGQSPLIKEEDDDKMPAFKGSGPWKKVGSVRGDDPFSRLDKKLPREAVDDQPVSDEKLVTPAWLLNKFQDAHDSLASNEWRFYERPDEIRQLVYYFLEFGYRETRLRDALQKSEESMHKYMSLRLQKLGLAEPTSRSSSDHKSPE